MSKKKFILNADDLGLAKEINKAVIDGYSFGILKSTSLVANGEAFNDAIENVLPQCPKLGVGIHLNITEGKSLCTDVNLLSNDNLDFNNNYLQLFIKTYSKKNDEFLEQLEREFRRQIETILAKTKVTHIDSHQHIHTIPRIFEMICRLAKEYKINQVRTHFEKLYLVPDVHKHLNSQYFSNLIKVCFYNILTLFNEATIHKYNLKTNDYIVGLIYNEMVEAITVAYGVMAVNRKNITVEAIIHPCRYENGTINNHFNEYLLTKNLKLKEKIEKLGFEITNYVETET